MKLLVMMMLSLMFVSCASQDRQIASEDEQALYQTERTREFGAGFRH